MNETDRTAAAPEAGEAMPLPPPTFEYLVFSIRTQAELSLGLLRFGKEEEKHEPDLEAARHAIDLLAMLQEKVRGNLSVEELTELRFRYVQAVEERGRPAQP